MTTFTLVRVYTASSVLAKRLAQQNVSETTYFLSSGT